LSNGYIAFSAPLSGQNYSRFVSSRKRYILIIWIKLNKLMRIIQTCLRKTIQVVLLVGAGCSFNELYPETDAARHDPFLFLAFYISLWQWENIPSSFLAAMWKIWHRNWSSGNFSRGIYIIFHLQKHGVVGYTTSIEPLRDLQANSKQDFSRVFLHIPPKKVYSSAVQLK